MGFKKKIARPTGAREGGSAFGGNASHLFRV